MQCISTPMTSGKRLKAVYHFWEELVCSWIANSPMPASMRICYRRYAYTVASLPELLRIRHVCGFQNLLDRSKMCACNVHSLPLQSWTVDTKYK